jgi:hypothetical protein
LERSILAVVGEDEEAASLGVMNHVLRKHMDIRDVHSANRPSWLAVPCTTCRPLGTARYATNQIARVLTLLLHNEQPLEWPCGRTFETPVMRRVMQCAARSAEEHFGRAWRIAVVIVCSDDAIEED